MQYILFLGLIMNSAFAINIHCDDSVTKDCFVKNVVFNMNDRDFYENAYFEMARPMCGWPPGGYTIKGKVKRIKPQQVYDLYTLVDHQYRRSARITVLDQRSIKMSYTNRNSIILKNCSIY
jgi:hypothetical protein